jgi:hypothetical protein
LLLIWRVAFIVCICLKLSGLEGGEHLLIATSEGLVIEVWTFVFLILKRLEDWRI